MVPESESGSFYLLCAPCGHFAAGTPDFYLLYSFLLAERHMDVKLRVAVLLILWTLESLASQVHF